MKTLVNYDKIKMVKRMKEKPLKNYIVLGLLFITVIALLIYIKSWADTYKSEKYSKSYLTDKVEEVKLSELEVSTKEMNDVLLLVTTTGDKKNYKQEERIYNYMKKENLINKFIYLDISNEKNYTSELSKIYSNILVGDVPLLIYIKNGNAIKVINSDNGEIDLDLIGEIINEYEL